MQRGHLTREYRWQRYVLKGAFVANQTTEAFLCKPTYKLSLHNQPREVVCNTLNNHVFGSKCVTVPGHDCRLSVLDKRLPQVSQLSEQLVFISALTHCIPALSQKVFVLLCCPSRNRSFIFVLGSVPSL